jgi:hypothetical protein
MEKYYQITSAVHKGSDVAMIAGSRGSAIDKVGDILFDRDMQVQDIYYRDEPHHHQEVLKCEDGSLFFIDRVVIN